MRGIVGLAFEPQVAKRASGFRHLPQPDQHLVELPRRSPPALGPEAIEALLQRLTLFGPNPSTPIAPWRSMSTSVPS